MQRFQDAEIVVLVVHWLECGDCVMGQVCEVCEKAKKEWSSDE